MEEDMSITLYAIYLPIVLTVIIWAVISLWPKYRPSGDYDFGASIQAFIQLVIGVILTLVVWLLYFAFT